MNNSNKIILNTAVSYVALIVKMVVGLFTVRFVLRALGEVNYGVYVVVGGIVAMLDILSSNMSNTSLRFLAHSLGHKNKDEILVTFNTTVYVHYIICIISVLVLEVGGLIMFEYIVNIPADKIGDAKIIYQFMIISTIITINAVPYDAVTNAHEKIWMLSIFDILQVFLSLSLALFLLVYDGNRLIMYSFCLMLIQFIMRIAKVLYAKKRFPECRRIQKKYFDKERMKEILSYTGWNLLGSITALLRGHLRSLIINMFFGVRLNAAEGVSRQVNKPLNMMVTSMTRAINPQIMKSEGGDNRERMKYLVMMGAKYSSFLFAVLGIPVLIKIPFLFDIWLDQVPEFAVIFCRLSLVSILLEKFTFQLVHAINAVGKIRNARLTGIFTELIIYPIAYVLFKHGYPAVTIYYLSIFSIVLGSISRLYFGWSVAEINPWEYLKKAVFSVLWPLMIATAVVVLLDYFIVEGWISVILVFLIFIMTFPALFWLMGMSEGERKHWSNMLKRFKGKVVFWK